MNLYMSKLDKKLLLFKLASHKVSAYIDFLKTSGINPERIKTPADFKMLPIMDKVNYLYRYPLKNLFVNGHLPPMVYASSGSSGKPTFWFRGDEQEETGGRIHETIFRKIFGVKKDEPTLVIICFSMGVWIAGNYTLASCRYLHRQGYKVSTISPGMEKEDIFNSLTRLAPQFKNVIIAGYPPFVMDVVVEALKRKINLPANLKILTAGDKFTESWRSSILKLTNNNDDHHSLVGIYGSADAGVLGYETPLSIFIRRKASENKKLWKNLFDDDLNLPAIVQYDPENIFFEEINGELVITANTAAPLIRYNIHDVGKIISYEEMKKILRDNGLTTEADKFNFKEWRKPFLILYGRTDVAVTFYALNIYPEHIKAGLDEKKISRFLSGNFAAYNKTLQNGKKQKLYIKLELNNGIKPTKKLLALTTRSLVSKLNEVNIEFRKLYSTLGEKALPVVSFCPYGDSNLKTKNSQGILSLNGKKPRVVL